VLLASRLDAALAAGVGVARADELAAIAKEITEAEDGLRQIDQLHIKFLHQAMALQREAERQKVAEKEAAQAKAEATATPPAATKTKSSKVKQR